LGNLLAKLQVKVVLEEITAKVPGLGLVEDQQIVFGDNLSFRAPTAVAVTWGEGK
jgi:cytochrome P450